MSQKKFSDQAPLEQHADTEQLSPEQLRLKLNKETAKISWQELERFYAKGMLIEVDKSLDLIAIATAFSMDDKAVIEPLLQQGEVCRVADERAMHWHEQQAQLWAVLVLPWLLVQEPKD